MFKVKFTGNMVMQLKEPDDEFPAWDKAYNWGVQKYGSGTYNSKYGWFVKEVCK